MSRGLRPKVLRDGQPADALIAAGIVHRVDVLPAEPGVFEAARGALCLDLQGADTAVHAQGMFINSNDSGVSPLRHWRLLSPNKTGSKLASQRGRHRSTQPQGRQRGQRLHSPRRSCSLPALFNLAQKHQFDFTSGSQP